MRRKMHYMILSASGGSLYQPFICAVSVPLLIFKSSLSSEKHLSNEFVYFEFFDKAGGGRRGECSFRALRQFNYFLSQTSHLQSRWTIWKMHCHKDEITAAFLFWPKLRKVVFTRQQWNINSALLSLLGLSLKGIMQSFACVHTWPHGPRTCPFLTLLDQFFCAH